MQHNPCSIIGAGGHGKVIAQLLRDLRIPIAGIFDDCQQLWGKSVLGVPITGPPSSIPDGAPAIIAIGDNRQRQTLAATLALDWQTLIHPTAYVADTVQIGNGTVVLPHAAIQVDARLGSHVIVNTSSTIEHDCSIGDFAHLAPRSVLAGTVELGDGVLMGTGASTVVGIKIGDWSVIGAGATVVNQLPPGITASGVPARCHPPL
ncbi:acetyltransferase [Roseiconus lacunae]|uniref:Acetyltransferase n=1 Tax=Roseiconus lacunae TaxID=2605694 RepID=A0ABT7PDL5_9BACT|nr:acetyltransferase [Roseiconus lacunae]MDM4014571.1 acetyltransferase [Roseiconus lacunae]